MDPSKGILSFGLVEGRPVFMDLENDVYFMLEPEEEQAFLIASKTRASGKRRAHDRVPWLSAVRARAARAKAHVLAGKAARPNFNDLLRVWVFIAQVRKGLGRRPLGLVLAELVEAANCIAAANDPAPLALRFASARQLIPLAPNCLSDSLALLRWLLLHESGATLVFGVKLDPFAAHCWVQSGGMLLNDHAENVARFTPVRTFECTPDTQ